MSVSRRLPRGLLAASLTLAACLAVDRPAVAQKRLSSAREMLELSGLEAPQLERLVDRRPLDADDPETVAQVLFALPRWGRAKLEAWAVTDPAWSALANDPASHRVEVFLVRGRIRHVERIALPAALAARFEYDHYYRVRCELPGSPHPAVVVARAVPQAWEHAKSLDELGGCYGLFLKVGDASGPRPELVFATDRVAWFPDREEPAEGRSATRVWLGELGFDVGLFDDVQPTNRQGLGGPDRECFYQLLAAAGQTSPDECLRRSEGPLDLKLVLSSPETQHGRLLTVTGVARRVQEIPVTEPDLRERFGLDHYYEVDVFVPLGNLQVRLGKGEPDETPVIQNDFPVTCCVRQLPADLPVGANVHQPVRLAGFFFKLWAYRSEYVSNVNPQQRQLAPLLIAVQPTVREPAGQGPPYLAWLVGTFFLLVTAGLLATVWKFRRSDRRFAAAMRRRQQDRGGAGTGS